MLQGDFSRNAAPDDFALQPDWLGLFHFNSLFDFPGNELKLLLFHLMEDYQFAEVKLNRPNVHALKNCAIDPLASLAMLDIAKENGSLAAVYGI